MQAKPVDTLLHIGQLHILISDKLLILVQDHFHKILPEADIEVVNAMYTEAAEEQLLGGSPDFVLDAIDNIDTKVALLAACHRRGLPVLSSAGAGMGSVAASHADVHTLLLTHELDVTWWSACELGHNSFVCHLCVQMW